MTYSYKSDENPLVIKQKYSLDEIIVIAPGTSSFKIGFAANRSPVTVPALFAVRRKGTEPLKRKSKKPFEIFNLSEIKKLGETENAESQREKNVLRVLSREILSSYVNIPSKEQLKQEQKFSKEDSLEILPKESSIVESLTVVDKGQYLFGESASNLKKGDQYDIYNIFRNGVLNVEDVSEPVLREIVTLYLQKLFEKNISISKDNFKKYCIAFVVPLSFCKVELMFFTKILMEVLGFKALLYHQEAVMACFGNGFSGACVVDVGHESSKISCVQYGSVVLSSKIILPFGGKEITELCLYSGLSPRINEYSFGLHEKLDDIDHKDLFILSERIKRENCSFPTDKRPVNNFIADVKMKDGSAVKVKSTFSNVCCLPPLGLFFPEILRAEGAGRASYGVHKIDECRFEYENSLLMDQRIENMSNSGNTKKRTSTKNKFKNIDLCQAIVESILSLPNAEDRMSMATSILLVGGSTIIPGMAEYIEKRVKKLIKEKKSNISHVEILPRRDEKDSGLPPDLCSWLGMSIICGNESCKEMWIVPDKWKKQKQLLLMRGTLPFELEIGVSNEIKRPVA